MGDVAGSKAVSTPLALFSGVGSCLEHHMLPKTQKEWQGYHVQYGIDDNFPQSRAIEIEHKLCWKRRFWIAWIQQYDTKPCKLQAKDL